MEAVVAALTPEEAQWAVMDRIADVVGALNVLHGELVALVAEVRDEHLWAAGDGMRSLVQWLGWQTGCSPASARRLLELADARSSHPLVSAELTAGRLTLDQAAAAVKVRPDCDRVMARLATASTVSQIRAEVRAANGPARTERPADTDDTVDDSPLDESLAQGWTEDGRWWLAAELDHDHGAIVRTALAEARDRLFRSGRTDVTWADALVDVAARSLLQVPDSRRELFRVNLFLDTTGTLTTVDGTVVPDAIRRHLTCDGMISPIFCDGAHPVAVGRSQRVVPERTRRIVEHRDGGRCANPMCLSSYGLEIHHIIHWLDGGPTDPWNLITLCAGCHRLHHQGRLNIAGNADQPDGVTFTDRHGRPFEKPQPRPPNRLPNPPPERYRRPCGEPLSRDALTGVFPQPASPN